MTRRNAGGHACNPSTRYERWRVVSNMQSMVVAYLKAHSSVRVMLVEKTDRLYRNLKDLHRLVRVERQDDTRPTRAADLGRIVGACVRTAGTAPKTPSTQLCTIEL